MALDLEVKYYGHATFGLTTPGGKRVIIDPWIDGNPACPDEAKPVDGLDLMLITHGHFDHVADAAALCQRFEPTVVAIHEIARWLELQGVSNTIGMNKGGTVPVDGLELTMTHAVHSSSTEQDGSLVYLGEAAGFVIGLENGRKIYFSGDTAVFGDMKLIAELHAPELAFLPIGSHYVMSPQEASLATRMLGVQTVVPMHFGTFPALTGTPEAYEKLVSDINGLKVETMKPGEIRTL